MKINKIEIITAEQSSDDVLCPIELSEYCGVLTVKTAPEARDIAEKFAAEHTAPFSRTAIAALKSRIKSRFCGEGSMVCSAVHRSAVHRSAVHRSAVHLIYRLDDTASLSGIDASGAVKLTRRSAAKYRNLTRYPLTGEGAIFPLFAVIEDGAVVAVAADNALPIAYKVNDIDVEVAPEYRRRGYGAVASAALCRHMLARKITPAGVVSERNAASCALMKKLGMSKIGRYFYIIIER